MIQSNVSPLKNMIVEMFIADEQPIPGIVIPNECHGTAIRTVDDGTEDIKNCDGLITTNTELVLGIYTADCVPVCFADGKQVGVIHAGWRGLCAGILEECLTQFNSETLEVFAGPHITSFTIQRDFCHELITERFGNQFFSFEGDQIIFNFREAVVSLLPGHTIFDARDTFSDISLPSYRREKTKDRLITTVRHKNNFKI